ncbi:hypothetical protein HDC30_000894 [Pseudomonas sp. JAI115]|uniref:hypothetical protein n=1 Tax=Pseudomonas sp. JAI115 TaxID=2723061 RepID=UPI001617E7B5|nr:hypothetical protein [Pseudomonas sp. JAI115]MBB6153700.1 hypothetical protein [Pseudomonas sp. JAI115]
MNTTTPKPERFPYGEFFKKVLPLRPTQMDVLVLPADTPPWLVAKVEYALKMCMPFPCTVVTGDVKLLDESAMNAAGWYRR